MTKTEKQRFVRDLTRSLRDKVLSDIKSGRIPKDWNGIELRQLLADRFKADTFEMSRRYKDKYNNDVLINCL